MGCLSIKHAACCLSLLPCPSAHCSDNRMQVLTNFCSNTCRLLSAPAVRNQPQVSRPHSQLESQDFPILPTLCEEVHSPCRFDRGFVKRIILSSWITMLLFATISHHLTVVLNHLAVTLLLFLHKYSHFDASDSWSTRLILRISQCAKTSYFTLSWRLFGSLLTIRL